MQDIKKPTEELPNIKAIMFNRTGDVIRGDFSVSNIIDLMEIKSDYKTYASYRKSNAKSSKPFNSLFSVSKPLYANDLKQYLSIGKKAELPSLVLFVPKQHQ